LIAVFWVGLVAWAALLVISTLRARAKSRKRRPGNNLACAAGAAVVNFVVFTILGISIGGYSLFLPIGSAFAGAAFVAAAALASIAVRLLARGRTAPAEGA
jgi:hypothetical protein